MTDGLLTLKDLREKVEELNSKIIIIDNIMALVTKSTADADQALKITQSIIEFGRTLDLSILILTHTPKGKEGKYLNQDDIAGSKTISNLLDSAFFIAKAKERKERYLKHVMARNSEEKENCDLIRFIDSPFVGFEYVGEYHEREVIFMPDQQEIPKKKSLSDYLEPNKEYTTKQIKEKVCLNAGVSERTVDTMIKMEKEEGGLKRLKQGFYMVSQNAISQEPYREFANCEIAKSDDRKDYGTEVEEQDVTQEEIIAEMVEESENHEEEEASDDFLRDYARDKFRMH